MQSCGTSEGWSDSFPFRQPAHLPISRALRALPAAEIPAHRPTLLMTRPPAVGRLEHVMDSINLRGRSLVAGWLALWLATAACSSSNRTMSPDAGAHADAAAGAAGGATGAAGATGANAGAGGGGGSAGGAGAAGGPGGSAGGVGGAPDAGQNPPPYCDLTCPAHQTCVVQANSPTCACVAGYQMSGTDCVWGTVPEDPGFQNVPEGAWTLKPGAILAPTAAGYLDPGQLLFSKSGPCARSGAHQTITMPTVAQAEPLAVKIVADADCISKLGQGCWPPDTTVVINGGAITFPDQPASIVNSACLGERAYGGTFDLEVRPLGQANCAVAHTDAIVDHVDIEPSSSCPVPGTIPDGDFDGTLDTWQGWADSPDAGQLAVFEIAPKLGTAGSAAAHLSVGGTCQDAAIEELISPPLSLPNLALQFAFKGTLGATVTVVLDIDKVAVLSGTGAQSSGHICLLESSKGMTQEFILQLGDVTSLATPSLICAPTDRDFVFDDLKFVTDPSCAATAYLADGGFERTDPAVAWDSSAQNGIDTIAANVHGGHRAMKMVNTDGCGTSEVTFPVTVPPSAAGAGPALQFFYKAPLSTNSNLSVTAGATTTGNLPASPTYTQAQICLDPTWSGQTFTVDLRLVGNESGLCTSIPTDTAWFDDFTVTTSAACPTE